MNATHCKDRDGELRGNMLYFFNEEFLSQLELPPLRKIVSQGLKYA